MSAPFSPRRLTLLLFPLLLMLALAGLLWAPLVRRPVRRDTPTHGAPVRVAEALAQASPEDALDRTSLLSEAYGRLPLSFEANAGQSSAEVKFLARGNGYNLFLTPTEAVLSLRATAREPARRRSAAVHSLKSRPGDPSAGVDQRSKIKDQKYSVLRMSLVGASRGASVEGLDLLPGRSNYFVGRAPSRWRTNVSNYSRVAGSYVRRGRREVGFEAADYDRSLPLVIDPVLSYSTFLGGLSKEHSQSIALDSFGNAYVTGVTFSTDFPVQGAFQATNAGSSDTFITKLNAAGTSLIYSTYLGGAAGADEGNDIALDSFGNAYVTGLTTSTNFPVTAGVFQTSLQGTLLLGNGTGGFGAATNFNVETNPVSVAAGDFNGDGKPDPATANRNSNDVSVLLGNGAGSFGTATNFGTAGALPLSVAVGDFNNDTRPNLAAANFSSNDVSILLVSYDLPDSSTISVTNTNDSGAGSLRQAILDANATVGVRETIIFQLPGAGVHTILPASALPDITDPVIIDGYTQPGSSPNTLATGDNAVLLVQITGNNTIQGAGLTITADNCVIEGLAVNGFNQLSGGMGDGSIEFNGAAATGGTVQGCFLGTDVTGLTAVPSLYGVVIVNDAQNNMIGGTTPAARNVISGNQVAGVGIGVGVADNGFSNSNIVQGNIIGADKNGTAALANSFGVFFQRGAQNNQVGGTAAGAGNIIAFNTNEGVVLSGGGAAPTSDSIQGNSIHDNGALGIDLSNSFGGNGVTPNDAGDADTGANNLQNFPVLSSASTEGNNTSVQGTLNSTASTTFRIEFFSNASCDASGNGEGRTFLGFKNVTTDGSGNATIIAPLAIATTVGEVITATATDPSNNTSEFSACTAITPGSGATLGNYPDATAQVSGNTTVTPFAAPTGAERLTVSTSTNFKGKLVGDPATGVVRITDAHPAGVYIVTVTAFDGGGAATTKTFTLSVTTPAACSAVTFAAAANFGVGTQPLSVAVGDFNGDGKQDLAVADASGGFGAGDVSVVLGNGAGGFSSSAPFNAGTTPLSVAVGDFNGDGKQDLAAANGNSANVSVLLGTGTGSFGGATNFAVGTAPLSVAVGDFNGDNKQDLVAANRDSNNLSVLLGDGSGGFGAAANFGVGNQPQSVAVGDFNGDGKQDLVAGNFSSNNLSVLLGDGSGSFGAAVNFGVGASPLSVALGDFNGDTKQDLAAANSGSNNLSVLLGDGSGSFSAAVNFGVGNAPFSVAVGDFDGDGKQDLATANQASNNLLVLLGDGAGSFGSATNFGVGTNPRSVAVGDFDGDGKQDLATANQGSDNLSVLLRQCTTATTFTVNSANDADDGTCNAAHCSLREAINAANANSGIDTIAFQLPGAGVQTITPTSPLPVITDPSVLDGSTQPGFAGVPLIEISGTGAGFPATGIRVTAGNTTIRALVINRFANDGIAFTSSGGNSVKGCFIGTNPAGTVALANGGHAISIVGIANNNIGGTTPADRNVLSGNGGRGVFVSTGSTNTIISGNFIGTNAAGNSAIGNSSDGVRIDGSSNNTVGGVTAGAGNVISGNAQDGVFITNNAANNLVAGNLIGTNANGNAAVANGNIGVHTLDSPNNTVGGTTAAARNLISGNTRNPVGFDGAGSTGNVLQGNFIGTDANGNSAIGNGLSVGVSNGASNNRIGGTAPGAGNLVSGNAQDGIAIFLGAHDNRVEGNLVGLNASGTASLGNQGIGIALADAGTSNNVVGGTTTAARNIISGNTGDGVSFLNGASGNALQGNFIGTNPAGTVVIANSGDGVEVNGSSNNTVGGAAAGAANLIAGNGGAGVSVFSGTGNTLVANRIFNNGALGIDLGANGQTPNDGAGDPDTGANDLQNFPFLLSAVSNGVSNSTTVSTLFVSKTNSAFTLHFYSSPSCDPSGNGEGETFLGAVNANTNNNGTDTPVFTFPVALPVGSVVTATATDAAGDTSEFSPCQAVTGSAFSISGRVRDPMGQGMLGINIHLAGSSVADTTTDASGNYTFAGLPQGGNFTLTPSETNFRFDPASRTVNNLQSDQSGVDFTGTLINHTMTGRVVDAQGHDIAGVTVTLAGSFTAVTHTDAQGSFIFTNIPENGSFVVTPEKEGFTFNPAQQQFNGVVADVQFQSVGSVQPSPTPTPDQNDDFSGGPAPDPDEWAIGILTNPPPTFDPLVRVFLGGGLLHIQPRSDANGPSYSGLVSVRALDLNSTPIISVEAVQAAGGAGAQTFFGLGSNSDNWFRFAVQDAAATTTTTAATTPPSSLSSNAAPPSPAFSQRGAGRDAAAGQTLLFEINVGGRKFSTGIVYDPSLHRFWRFRFDAPARLIIFETSPDAAGWTERFRAQLPADQTALIAELSAGTSRSTTNPTEALFDNFLLSSSPRTQFTASAFNARESDAAAHVQVIRTGSDENPVTVDLATSDGTAHAGSDYTPVRVTLTFGIGERLKTVDIPLVNDAAREEPETLNVSLSNPVGGRLGSIPLAVLTILDDDGTSANPVDQTEFFVRQHYLDFLGREADAPGLAFWINNIESCGANAGCRDAKRVDTSAAFFLSIEFQQTGFVVHRFYRASFGRPPKFSEYLPDLTIVREGVTVGEPGALERLELNKRLFAEQWTNRAAFKQAYDKLNEMQYVDALAANAALTLAEEERTALIVGLLTRRETRAGVLLKIVENEDFARHEFNAAFVRMEYFGYLRRDPDDVGFRFWLSKLERFGGDFHKAEMVRAFLSSIEYRTRFGQP